jgi:plasmid maintenance system killer protein
MDIAYTASFVRRYKKLPRPLKDEVKERINTFRDPIHHESLRVHKLNGPLKKFHSFSVNYRYRIIFQFVNNGKTAHLHDIDDHEIYER